MQVCAKNSLRTPNVLFLDLPRPSSEHSKAGGTVYFNESHKSDVIGPRLSDASTIMC